MEHLEPPPDLIVGIDLGHTFSGVSFQFMDQRPQDVPSTIANWPGQINETKVPTMYTYQRSVIIWGFQARSVANKRIVAPPRRYFKVLLDDTTRENENKNIRFRNEQYNLADEEYTLEGIKEDFKIFFKQLYLWITTEIANSRNPSADLSGLKVDYIFSVPTTWNEVTVQRFLQTARDAGFGEINGHEVKKGLNEAEAAAVHAALGEKRRKFQEGDILVVCDAGGGTTDVSLLRTGPKTQRKNLPTFEALHNVEGRPVGSVDIDRKFERYVEEVLSTKIPGLDAGHISAIADDATTKTSDFITYKHGHGESSFNLKFFPIKLSGLDRSLHYEDLDVKIANGTLSLRRDKMVELFEEVLKPIFQLLDIQINILREKAGIDRQKIYFLLSGGLGSSKYVQQRLKERYKEEIDMEIAVADEAQLVVCRGLVLNRIHEIQNTNLFTRRCCVSSYGFIGDEDRKANNISRFPIRWFIEKDKPVKVHEPIKVDFSRVIKKETTLHHKVVKYDGTKELLELREEDITRVCTVSFDVTPDLLKTGMKGIRQKKKRFWKFATSTYTVLDYEVRVYVQSVGLRFDIWLGDGERRFKVEDHHEGWTPEDWRQAEEEPKNEDIAAELG